MSSSAHPPPRLAAPATGTRGAGSKVDDLAVSRSSEQGVANGGAAIGSDQRDEFLRVFRRGENQCGEQVGLGRPSGLTRVIDGIAQFDQALLQVPAIQSGRAGSM